jgi:hypothetical protein
MNPGLDQIIACPHCQGFGKYLTLLSGNTFGARIWTDTRQIAPMCPWPPAVVKCRHCAGCYWRADARKVGPPFGADSEELDGPAWARVDYVEEPTEAEYFSAIEGDLARGRKREVSLRILAWQRANDPFRESPSEGIKVVNLTKPDYRSNLRRLASLLGEADDDARFRKAAVLRELGRFKVASEILDCITSPGFVGIVQQLRSLCDRCDARFREFFPAGRGGKGWQ